MPKSKTKEQLKYHNQNQQNTLKETVLEEQQKCRVTSSFVKITERELKVNKYANRDEVTHPDRRKIKK